MLQEARQDEDSDVKPLCTGRRGYSDAGRLQSGSGTSTSTVPSLAAPDGTLPSDKTFRYTGNRQSFIVPRSIKRLHIVALGGMGAGPGSSGDVRPGRVSALIPVTPGEELYVFVGGVGSGQAGGFNGGGDGGSDSYCECTGYGGGGGRTYGGAAIK